MHTLIILVSLLAVHAFSKSYQKGSWNKQVYDNSSFLFNFIPSQSGYAVFTTKSDDQYLLLTLSDSENGESRINMRIWMVTVKYLTDASFQLTNKHIKFSLERDNSPTFGQEQMSSSIIPFNITYVPRTSLELKSAQGTFTIQAVDIQKISPFIYEKLWGAIILIGAIYFLVQVFSNPRASDSNLDSILGLFSMEILAFWTFRYTYFIWDQTYYLSDTSRVSWLSFVVFLVLIVQAIAAITYLQIAYHNHNFIIPKSAVISQIVHIGGIILFFQPFITLQLWYVLLPISLYELLKVFVLQIQQKMVFSQIIKLLLMYSFSIVFFPLLAFEIAYPESEASHWWVYLLFFLAQITFFQLRTNGGLKLRLKRTVYALKRCFKRESYLTLQESMCPICFKEVQVSEMNMAAAGDIQKNDWVKAPCNHYFHRVCLKSKMNSIDRCFFDNTKWTSQFISTLS